MATFGSVISSDVYIHTVVPSLWCLALAEANRCDFSTKLLCPQHPAIDVVNEPTPAGQVLIF